MQNITTMELQARILKLISGIKCIYKPFGITDDTSILNVQVYSVGKKFSVSIAYGIDEVIDRLGESCVMSRYIAEFKLNNSSITKDLLVKLLDKHSRLVKRYQYAVPSY